MPASYAHPFECFCPECDQAFEASLWLVVDDRDNAGAIERCRNDTVHCHRCPGGHPFRQEAPLLIVHRASDRLLYSPAPRATREQGAQELAALIDRVGHSLPWKTRQALGAALWVVRRDIVAAALAIADGETIAELDALYQASSPPAAGGVADQLERCQRALGLFTRDQAPMLWVTFASRLANALRSEVTGNRVAALETAIGLSEAAVAECQRHDEPLRVAIAQMNLGALYGDLALADGVTPVEREAALDREGTLLGAVLEVFYPRLFPSYFAFASNNLAVNLFKRPVRQREADTEQVITVLEKGIAAITPERDPELWGDMHQHLGIAFFRRVAGDRGTNIERSIDAYRQALVTRTAAQTRALTLMDLGNSLLERVRCDKAETVEEAIDTYLCGAELAAQCGSRIDWARFQYDLSYAYRLRVRGDRMDNVRSAIAAGMKALSVFTASAHPDDWARVQQNLGNAYAELYRAGDAEAGTRRVEALSAALTVWSPERTPADFLKTSDNLAAALTEGPDGKTAGVQERAIEILRRAERIDLRDVPPHVHVKFLVNLATAYSERQLGDREENRARAIETFRRAAALARQQFQYAELRLAAIRLAGLLCQQGDWQGAYEELTSALSFLDQSYSHAVGEAGREHETETNWFLSQLLTEACLRLGRTTEAFIRWDEGCARALRDELSVLDLPAPDAPDDALAEERALLDRSRELDLAIRSAPSVAARNEAINELIAVRARLDELWTALARDPQLAEYVGLRRGERLRWSEVTDWLARQPRATAIVSFARLRRGWVVFIVRTRDAAPRVEELSIDDEDVSVVAEAYRAPRERSEAVGDGDANEARLREVSNRLLSPMRAHLSGIECVGLVLYGNLHYIPVHALASDEGMLIDSSAVVYLPSVTVTVRRSPPTRIRTATRALVVGNPTGDLTGAEEEALVVARLLDAKPLIGKSVTVEDVRRGLRDADVIHIAAHATFSSVDPFSSGIVFADGAVLAARDIMAERIGAALVVLSACETGVQYARVSNSLDGLIRAFLYAGAGALVVSLWEVDDVSTMLLLTEFYNGLSKGLGVCEAMRHAQLAFRAGDRMNKSFEDPYHWAPFVVVGAPD